MMKNDFELNEFGCDGYRIELYPDDHKYRCLLAENINCNPCHLMSIIGPDELCSMLPGFTYENFDPGNRFQNLKDGTYRANLHIHTTESDGKMTIETLLDQAVDYGEKLIEPPFLFAITNHDSVDDSKKALKLIAEDPLKYKKVRVVLGAELSGKYFNKNHLDAPIKYELLGYCINPFEEGLNNHLQDFTSHNKEFTKDFLDKFNNNGFKVTYDEACAYHNLIKIGSSAGLLFILKEFLLCKAKEEGFSNKFIYEIFEEHKKEIGHEYLTGKSPDLDTLFSVVDSGIMGIAHPGRINIESPRKGVSIYDALNAFVESFCNNGGIAAEINYLYPNYYFNHGFREYLKEINQICSQFNLLNTGGIDNHGPNLFIRD